MEFLLLLVGLAGLWLGTEAAIRGAVSVAERLGVSEFIIGVAILSVGSDLPELAIAIDAAIKNLSGADASDVVVGSALGSGLGQIGFVLGIAGLLAYLTLPRHIVFRHGSVLLGTLFVLALIGLDGVVTRTEGLILISLYLVYLAMLFTEKSAPTVVVMDDAVHSLLAAGIYLVVGLVVVIVSAELTVSSAVDLAAEMGIEQAFVAVIIIGLGSSLPELSISVAAVLKGRATLSVGNLIGSNIFDTLVPIGTAAVIANLGFNEKMLFFELPFLFLVTFVALVFFLRKPGIQKVEALIILAAYAGYVSFKFVTAPT